MPAFTHRWPFTVSSIRVHSASTWNGSAPTRSAPRSSRPRPSPSSRPRYPAVCATVARATVATSAHWAIAAARGSHAPLRSARHRAVQRASHRRISVALRGARWGCRRRRRAGRRRQGGPRAAAASHTAYWPPGRTPRRSARERRDGREISSPRMSWPGHPRSVYARPQDGAASGCRFATAATPSCGARRPSAARCFAGQVGPNVPG
jgi:hypothetical protein